ncbi:MAG: glycerol-3-phosphate responsive antiterminator [Clostridia bacterium]|nr:glycerol-3-phosphate responsive antiterminator [Clostridia bacterium]
MSSVIAAVRTQEEFEKALASGVGQIFDLSPDLLTLQGRIKAAHAAGKKLFVHFDLATGIGKDKSGIAFAAALGVDGVISTRVNIIRMAREAGLYTVQRFFIVDSHSIETTIEAVKVSKADTIEVMPGIASKIIRVLKEKIEVPIIAGGLIETAAEAAEAYQNGASAISTGKADLWD